MQEEVNTKDEETRRLQEEVEDARRRQEEATAALVAASSTPQHHHVMEAEDDGENDEALANGELGKAGSLSSEDEHPAPLLANGERTTHTLREALLCPAPSHCRALPPIGQTGVAMSAIFSTCTFATSCLYRQTQLMFFPTRADWHIGLLRWFWGSSHPVPSLLQKSPRG